MKREVSRHLVVYSKNLRGVFGGIRLAISLMAAIGTGVFASMARSAEFEIFQDSFESPAMSGRLEMDIPGWWRSDSRVGLWNEDSSTMSTPFGAQALWLWSGRSAKTTNITDTMVVGASYTLTFNVAAENALGGINYLAEIMAGTNAIASSVGGPIASSTFASTTGMVHFAATTNHIALGSPLGVRFTYISGDWHYVIGGDNVKLVADEDPAGARSLFYGK